MGTVTVLESNSEAITLTNILNKTVTLGDKLCIKCRRCIRVPIRKKSYNDKVQKPIKAEASPSSVYREDIISERASSSSSDNVSINNRQCRNGSNVYGNYKRDYTETRFAFFDSNSFLQNDFHTKILFSAFS